MQIQSWSELMALFGDLDMFAVLWSSDRAFCLRVHRHIARGSPHSDREVPWAPVLKVRSALARVRSCRPLNPICRDL